MTTEHPEEEEEEEEEEEAEEEEGEEKGGGGGGRGGENGKRGKEERSCIHPKWHQPPPNCHCSVTPHTPTANESERTNCAATPL